MLEKLSTLSPAVAWQTLPASQWDEAAARHLLQRVGFSATPLELTRALADGPTRTVRRYFAAMPTFPKPSLVANLQEDAPKLIREMTGVDAEQKRSALRVARERSREALLDMILKWLQVASQPANSPTEKWLLFLSDVWVVSLEKVKNADLIFEHQDLIRAHALGSAVDLAKAMSRSPAMIVYLDLQQSKPEAPNENFARELFELFTLGEGNYTETDIKQAARAFTGYRQRQGEFIFARRQHDDGEKTVFGQTGDFNGDDVLDLVFQKRAAATFLPKEMVRFYLCDVPLPAVYTDALGSHWAGNAFDLRELAVTFFSSRVFYTADFRGNFIKSPVQFYLGLLQNLDLAVEPIARQVVGPLRQMGQLPFDPPNVRGWVGGRAWINSATLAARRALIAALLRPLNEAVLNADDKVALSAARASGFTRFTMDDERLAAWARLPPAEAAAQLLARTLPGRNDTELQSLMEEFLQSDSAHPEAAVRTALGTLFEAPDYQLC